MSYVFDKISVPADRSRINISDPVEVRWWSRVLGCSAKQLLLAVSHTGDAAAKVERLLDFWQGFGVGARTSLKVRAA